MDPVRNPYSPGAGSPPPELAGREVIQERVRIVLERIRASRAARSVILIGLRGVGKTVLLDRLMNDARGNSVETMRIEASEDRSLPAIVVPQLRIALLNLSRNASARTFARRALRGLAGFVGALRVSYNDIEVGLDLDPEPGLADNGDLESDLISVLEVAGTAAQKAKTALVLFIDEMQYVQKPELAALTMALHRISQLQLPVVLVGAGLPQLPGQFGRAKTYAERLFDFVTVDPLGKDDARRALVEPARHEGADYEEPAVKRIVKITMGYPYFLQEWGSHCWDAADSSPITLKDVKMATAVAVASLDESFFRVRFDRLSPSERTYLRAMAELGPGPHRSGDISAALGRPVQSVAPVRRNLIKKGMIWSPGHGNTAFTVPMFDEFMRRAMPGDGRKVVQ